ncbi:MAG: insulinase family protein [Gemmatimonadaceae bacterium]|nr:insulinase family protein [Gemmatimonadaceae bacterium]
MRHSEALRRVVASGVGVALLVGAAGAAGRSHTIGATHGALRRERIPSTPAVPAHDPALTIGTLPNGMRYYLRVNKAPAHRVELRLAVNAGSMLEDDDQRGFAHFLEHMAFNGTTHFPRNTLIDFIETSGMRFGADLNAFTTQDETVYLLTLPSDDATILSKGLDLLQDWASGGITIDSAEVVAERGVIMGEWRTRLVDTLTQQVQGHYDTLLTGGSPYLTRNPIGDTTLLTHAEPAPIKRFYHDWYRPGLMAVIVVGDFDPVAMKREIERRFGAIPAPAHPRPRTAPRLPVHDATVVDVYKRFVPPSIQVLWPAARQPADARAAMRQALIQELLINELQQQLLRIREHPSRPFVVAQIQGGSVVRPLKFVGVQIAAFPDSLERGLATVLGELERVARHGIPAATLARRKAALLACYEHAALGASGQGSAAYADAYVQHYLTGDASLLSAQQELTLAREILPTITPPVLAQAARFWREPAGRRVLIGVPKFANRAAPTNASILALLDPVQHAQLPPLADKLATTGVRAMSVNIGFADESVRLVGSPRSLSTLFQLLHLQFTAPMLDSATFAGWQSLAKYQGAAFSIDDQLNQTLAGQNPRMQPVSTQLAELASVKDLLAAHHDRFGNAADFTFVIVGAVTPAEVRPLVERYVASLPSTGEHETPQGEDVKPFLHRVTRIVPVVPVPRAQTMMVFDGPFPSTPDAYLRERQRLSAVQLVLQDRLRVRLREELAGTYSPFSQSETLALPNEHFRVLIGFDAAPERMHSLNLELEHLIDTLRVKGVTEAEATRAATIQRRQLETALQSNGYWTDAIVRYHRLGIPLDRIPTPFPERVLTPAELQTAAKQYLPDDVFLHFTAMPADSTSYPHPDSATTR